MIFHGASDMTLSFVVEEHSADDVVRRLHYALFPKASSETEPSRQLNFLPLRNAQLENLVTGGEA